MTLAIRAESNGSPFDEIMEIDTDGTPVWRARKLMELMGYPRWSDFQRVIARALTSAQNTGMDVERGFRRSPETSGSGQGARPRDDIKLIRDAAYLVAMNGDPNKDEVAGAQRYFVEQTKRQERQEVTAQAPHVAGQVDDLVLLESLIQVVRANRQQVAAVQAAQLRQAEEQRVLSARIDGIEGNHDFFAALAYAKMNGLSTERGYLQRLGTAAARITRRMGVGIGKAPHALYGHVNTYPIAALDEAVELLAGAA